MSKPDKAANNATRSWYDTEIQMQQVAQEQDREEERESLRMSQRLVAKQVIPQDDDEIKDRLRQMGLPVCFFGERPIDRRNRYATSMTDYFNQNGDWPLYKPQKKRKRRVITDKQEENDHFFYPGSSKLPSIRTRIGLCSLKAAAIRLAKQRIYRMETDPLEREEEIDREVETIQDLDIFLSQSTTSALTRGQFSHDGSLFGTASASGEGQIWDIEAKLKSRLIGHEAKLHDFKFNTNSSIVSSGALGGIATSSSDRTIRLWALQQDALLQDSVVLQGHEDRVNRIAFHPTGDYLISSSHDSTWRFWDLTTTEEVLLQTGHEKPVYGLAIHPDGSLVYTGDFAGVGALWDLRTGKLILQLQGHLKKILCADFSSNGYHLVTGGEDNVLRLWDIRRKRCFAVVPAHFKLISDVLYQPQSSQYIISVSYDSALKIWNTKDFSMAKTVTAHEGKITSVSMTQDGQHLATTALDRKWMLWKH